MTVVVLPTIYGPALDWQGDGEALAAALPANALHEDDAAYALLQLLTRGTAATRVVIDGTDAALQQELGWRPHYTLATGVQRVWPQIRARRVAAQQAAVTHNAGAHWLVLARRAVPYVENIAGALLLQRVAILQGGTPVSNGIAFDMNFLYIGTMGLVYGQRQAFIAMVLAMTLLVHGWLGTGHDIVGLLYEPVALLHLTTYLFIACLTGYFADRRQEKQAASWAADEAQERYRELAHFYDEALHTKDALYRQIVNTDDSIGRLYSIIRRLDTVDLENVFDQAASVTAEVLSVHDIIIYIPDRAGDYLRSKVRLGALTRDLPRSLRRTEQGWLQLVCQEQQIFVNRDLLQDVPDLAAPVVYEGQVVAVVAVYGLRFDQWSLYQQNLLSVTTRLIASSLGRARQFADGLEARRYVAGTHLLQAAAFAEVRAGLARRQERQTGFGLVLLRLARGLYPYTQAAARTGAGGARGLAGARASAAGGGRRAGGADGHGRFYHAVPAARGAAAAGL